MTDESRKAEVVAWSIGVQLGIAVGLSVTAVAQTAGFTPGGREIFLLNIASTPIGGGPTGIRVLRGSLQVVEKDGVRMLKASTESEFLITLPEALPQDFTLEFELIPKMCCNPADLMFEGTPTISRSTSSAHVVWDVDNHMVVGGGAMYQTATPADLRETLPGQLSRIAASFEGGTLKMYTNGRRLYTLSDRRFVRGRVLRVYLGGQDAGDHAVYLARLRITAGTAAALATQQSALSGSDLAGQPSGGSIQAAGSTKAPGTAVTDPTVTPRAASGAIASGPLPVAPAPAPPPPPPPPLERAPTRGTLTILSGGPAPSGLNVTGTPITATLSWSAVPGATGYGVSRSLSGTTDWRLLTETPITATELKSDLLPEPSRSYTYQVRAYQADGKFGSATIDFTPPRPADPPVLYARSDKPGVVVLDWHPAAPVKKWLVTGPGIPPGTQVDGGGYTVAAAPPGINLYRVASVYEPGGVLTPNSAWPSAAVGVAPVALASLLTMPNGAGSWAEYNRHVCNAGKWVAAQLVWPNDWCDIKELRVVAEPYAFPLLALYGIQEFQDWDGLRIFPATEWTNFTAWPWSRGDVPIPHASFRDQADMGQDRIVGCASRGSGAGASTMCWAGNALHHGDAGSLTVIVQTWEETHFLRFSGDGSCAGCRPLMGEPRIVLDSKGPRMLPHACLACHGGRFDPQTGKVTGASLLPLDPRGFSFQYSDGKSRASEAIRQINLTIFTSNATLGVREYITNMYQAKQTVVGTTVDENYVPSAWADQPGLYRDIYRPYCALCHSTQTGPLGFRSWGDLLRERARVKHAICEGTMPHGEVSLKRFWADGAPVVSRPGVLLAALGYPSC